MVVSITVCVFTCVRQHYGIPRHFGLFYAMGVALMMEGFLSACYHVCPNHSNFQFGKLQTVSVGRELSLFYALINR